LGHAAHRDADQDRYGPGDLPESSRITEDDHSGERADDGFDIHEGSGHLGGHSALPVGEQCERRQCPADRESQGRQQGSQAAGCRDAT
jgi:hypothetical protein